MEQQTSSNGEFGKSDFGERLVYVEEGCCVGWKDRWWAVFYYLHVGLIVFLAILYWGVLIPKETTPSPTIAFFPTTTESKDDDVKKAATAFFVTLLLQMFIGAIFGLFWLKIIQMYAETIIKTMFILALALWLVTAIVGFVIGSPPLGVIGLIGFLIYGAIVYCNWKRIPFSSVLLTIASVITQTFEGTICISLCSIPMNIFWFFVWLTTFAGYIIYSSVADKSVSVPIVFLLLISFYWGCQVNKNVPHTTSCGVTAAWYFSKNLSKPTMPALKRTMTTSFGSVCFGSFIVAVIQATKQIIRTQNRGPLACVAICLLYCLEKLIKYFNLYAFAQCAIYGSSFIEGAKATWSLFVSKGFSAIINDHLTGLALACGAFLAFVVSGLLGYLIAYALLDGYSKESSRKAFAIVSAIYGGFVGMYMCKIILQVVQSSIICLFVCFAEDPNALKMNRPDQFNALIQAKEPLNQFAISGHTGLNEKGEAQGQETTGQQQPQ